VELDITGHNWTKWPSSVFSRTATNNEPKPFGPFGVHGPLIMPNHAPYEWRIYLGWIGMMMDDVTWCFTWAPIGFSGTLGPSSMWLSSFFLRISLGQTALGPWAVCPKEAIRSPPNLRSQSDHPSLTASSHDLGRWAFGCRRKACELHQVWGPRDLGGVFFCCSFFWITLVVSK